METQYGFPRTHVRVLSANLSNTLLTQRRAADGALFYNGTKGLQVFPHTWYQILEWATVCRICGVFPHTTNRRKSTRLCCELLAWSLVHTHMHTHTRSLADNQSVCLPYLAVPGESEAERRAEAFQTLLVDALAPLATGGRETRIAVRGLPAARGFGEPGRRRGDGRGRRKSVCGACAERVRSGAEQRDSDD